MIFLLLLSRCNVDVVVLVIPKISLRELVAIPYMVG